MPLAARTLANSLCGQFTGILSLRRSGPQVYGADLNCSESGGEAGRDPPVSVRIGRIDPARFDFERVHGHDDHIDGPPFNPPGRAMFVPGFVK